MKTILKLEGVQLLSVKAQKNINGGKSNSKCVVSTRCNTAADCIPLHPDCLVDCLRIQHGLPAHNRTGICTHIQ
ncbi:hypothetical protein [Tenacibaculum sp. 190524A05c]|uniref:Uncharacterized protein n=1 Tax=Tenacibaculum platacis TaxID=3137852 RepID=A0ABP1EKQ5_9FLAO